MILYADDDQDDTTMFNDIVRRETGLQPITFPNGQALIDYTVVALPGSSVIFLDLNMPIKNGLEALRAIRSGASWKRVPVVILTTSDSPEMKSWTFRHGANLFITKPNSYGELERSLRYALSINWSLFRTDESNFVCRA